MNKEQFIFWLKGFAKAVNEEGPTPKQWETIVSELDKIKDCPDFGSPIDLSNPFPRWQEPHYINPWDKYKVTCNQAILTTTSGSGSTYNIPGITTHGDTSWTSIPNRAFITYTSGSK